MPGWIAIAHVYTDVKSRLLELTTVTGSSHAESHSHFDSATYTGFMSNSKSCWADIVMSEFAVFQVQANNYATFYDDQMQNWSVMFESSGDAIEFAREVSRTGTP